MTDKIPANDPQLAHDRIADRFDQLLNDYDTTRRIEVLVSEFLASVPAGGLILDGGCGTGRGTVALQKRGTVVAVDIGQRLTSLVRTLTGCGVARASLLDLPFKAGTFDIVFSSEVVEHTPDPAAAVRELYRVVKPGGRLVLSTPNWIWQTPVRIASALKLRPYDGFENFLGVYELHRVLKAEGAEIVEHRGIHLWPFQLRMLQPVLRKVDRLGALLLPLMINQCVLCRKPVG